MDAMQFVYFHQNVLLDKGWGPKICKKGVIVILLFILLPYVGNIRSYSWFSFLKWSGILDILVLLWPTLHLFYNLLHFSEWNVVILLLLCRSYVHVGISSDYVIKMLMQYLHVFVFCVIFYCCKALHGVNTVYRENFALVLFSPSSPYQLRVNSKLS